MVLFSSYCVLCMQARTQTRARSSCFPLHSSSSADRMPLGRWQSRCRFKCRMFSNKHNTALNWINDKMAIFSRCKSKCVVIDFVFEYFTSLSFVSCCRFSVLRNKTSSCHFDFDFLLFYFPTRRQHIFIFFMLFWVSRCKIVFRAHAHFNSIAAAKFFGLEQMWTLNMLSNEHEYFS